MTKRTTGAAQAAPAPRKRRSGKSGRNRQAGRLLRADPALWALVDAAIALDGGSWSEWARRVLSAAARGRADAESGQ